LQIEFCRDEAAFSKSMMEAIEEKFQVGRNLKFAFIDSWARHRMNLEDQQQQDAFTRETNMLWKFALNFEELVFKSIQDVLDENKKLKRDLQYRDETIDFILEQLVKINSDIGNLTETVHKDIEKLSENLKEAEKDITGLRIESSKHSEDIDEIKETLISHQSQLSVHDNTLDGVIETDLDHQLSIDDLSLTSASHQTSIDVLKSVTGKLDLLPLGTIMSYHPKNAETFPLGWLPCDGSVIDKGPLMGQKTPGNLT
jgi:hypothetical protein